VKRSLTAVACAAALVLAGVADARAADTVAPVISNPGGLAASSGWVRGTQPFGYDAYDAGGVWWLEAHIDGAQTHTRDYSGHCTFSGGTPTACPPSVSTPAWTYDTARLADGRHTLDLYAMDIGKNWASAGPLYFRSDNTAPVPSLSGAGSPTVPHPDAITVTLSARDAASGMGGGHVAWKLDAGAWVVVPGDEAGIPVAGDGNHTLAYYAVDAAGNRSAEQSRTILIRSPASSFPAGGLGFSVRTVNPKTTFTAARRFGAPCPAETTLVANRDSSLVEGDPSERYGASGTLSLGPAMSRRDVVVGFPLPAAVDCTVESARLRLYSASFDAGYPGRPIAVTRASSSWDEATVTWGTRPGTVGAATTATIPSQASWVEWDVTAHVQAMYRYGDNGLYLRDAGPAQTGGLIVGFCGREGCSGAVPPQLLLRFTE
jgi:hypothetical protein